MNKYWFARRFPLNEPNANRMEPVSIEGWMVVTFLAGAMIAGAAGLFALSFTYGAPLMGLVILFGFAAVGIAAFLVAVSLRGDRQHTIDEYKSGRVVNQR